MKHKNICGRTRKRSLALSNLLVSDKLPALLIWVLVITRQVNYLPSRKTRVLKSCSSASLDRNYWDKTYSVLLSGSAMTCHPKVHTKLFFVLFLNCIPSSFFTPQWGAADAEIKVPSGENTELKPSPFEAWSRSVYSHTCYAYCQGFLSFLLISTLPAHSPAFFPKPLPIFSCIGYG